jgi:hypothetical protein
MRAVKRFGTALLLFATLGIYVWAAQVEYDAVSTKSNPVWKATLFLIALFGGSLTYDIAKRMVFMSAASFDIFFGKLLETSLAFCSMFAFFVAAAAFLSYPSMFPFWLGVTTYVIACVLCMWVVAAGSNALEAGFKA